MLLLVFYVFVKSTIGLFKFRNYLNVRFNCFGLLSLGKILNFRLNCLHPRVKSTKNVVTFFAVPMYPFLSNSIKIIYFKVNTF